MSEVFIARGGNEGWLAVKRLPRFPGDSSRSFVDLVISAELTVFREVSFDFKSSLSSFGM